MEEKYLTISARGVYIMTSEENKHFLKSALDAILKKITGGINVFLFFILTAMGLILGVNIVMRFLFDNPIAWSNVVTRYAYIYIVLLGTAISYIEDSHAQIDFVYAAVPKKVQGVFDTIHYLCMMFLCGILVIFGTKHVITMWPVHSPVVKGLSIGVLYLSVPVSAAVTLFFLIIKMLEVKFN